MSVRAQPHRRAPAIGFAVAALVLAWLVVSHSFAAYLADGAPQAALWLNPNEPAALLNRADAAINAPQGRAAAPPDGAAQAAQPAGANRAPPRRDFSEFGMIDAAATVDLPAVRGWAEAALKSAPLNARALRILGQAAAASGKDADANRFMQMAAQLSLHESAAVYWLLVRSVQSKDYKSALTYADVVLRTLPGFDPYVMPLLARMIEDGTAVDLFKTALAADPPWRTTVLQNLPRAVGDERIPLDLLLALRSSRHPPRAAEVDAYLNFLAAHRMYELAYYTWLQFLRRDELGGAGLLYNGNFEVPLSGAPFDWRIEQGAGVNIDVAERPDKNGDHALRIDFEYGRVEYHSINQLLMLAPGRYHLHGIYQGELVGPRGLKWRLACAETPDRPFAASAMIVGRVPAWSDVELDFEVPADKCRAQYVSLDLDARMPSEQFLTGTIWFDDLRIQRAASAARE